MKFLIYFKLALAVVFVSLSLRSDNGGRGFNYGVFNLVEQKNSGNPILEDNAGNEYVFVSSDDTSVNGYQPYINASFSFVNPQTNSDTTLYDSLGQSYQQIFNGIVGENQDIVLVVNPTNVFDTYVLYNKDKLNSKENISDRLKKLNFAISSFMSKLKPSTNFKDIFLIDGNKLGLASADKVPFFDQEAFMTIITNPSMGGRITPQNVFSLLTSNPAQSASTQLSTNAPSVSAIIFLFKILSYYLLDYEGFLKYYLTLIDNDEKKVENFLKDYKKITGDSSLFEKYETYSQYYQELGGSNPYLKDPVNFVSSIQTMNQQTGGYQAINIPQQQIIIDDYSYKLKQAFLPVMAEVSTGGNLEAAAAAFGECLYTKDLGGTISNVATFCSGFSTNIPSYCTALGYTASSGSATTSWNSNVITSSYSTNAPMLLQLRNNYCSQVANCSSATSAGCPAGCINATCTPCPAASCTKEAQAFAAALANSSGLNYNLQVQVGDYLNNRNKVAQPVAAASWQQAYAIYNNFMISLGSGAVQFMPTFNLEFYNGTSSTSDTVYANNTYSYNTSVLKASGSKANQISFMTPGGGSYSTSYCNGSKLITIQGGIPVAVELNDLLSSTNCLDSGTCVMLESIFVQASSGGPATATQAASPYSGFAISYNTCSDASNGGASVNYCMILDELISTNFSGVSNMPSFDITRINDAALASITKGVPSCNKASATSGCILLKDHLPLNTSNLIHSYKAVMNDIQGLQVNQNNESMFTSSQIDSIIQQITTAMQSTGNQVMQSYQFGMGIFQSIFGLLTTFAFMFPQLKELHTNRINSKRAKELGLENGEIYSEFSRNRWVEDWKNYRDRPNSSESEFRDIKTLQSAEGNPRIADFKEATEVYDNYKKLGISDPKTMREAYSIQKKYNLTPEQSKTAYELKTSNNLTESEAVNVAKKMSPQDYEEFKKLNPGEQERVINKMKEGEGFREASDRRVDLNSDQDLPDAGNVGGLEDAGANLQGGVAGETSPGTSIDQPIDTASQGGGSGVLEDGSERNITEQLDDSSDSNPELDIDTVETV